MEAKVSVWKLSCLKECFLTPVIFVLFPITCIVYSSRIESYLRYFANGIFRQNVKVNFGIWGKWGWNMRIRCDLTPTPSPTPGDIVITFNPLRVTILLQVADRVSTRVPISSLEIGLFRTLSIRSTCICFSFFSYEYFSMWNFTNRPRIDVKMDLKIDLKIDVKINLQIKHEISYFVYW